MLLLAALLFGMVHTTRPSAYAFVMFAGLIAAGATGALVRGVIWGPVENDPRTSLLLGRRVDCLLALRGNCGKDSLAAAGFLPFGGYRDTLVPQLLNESCGATRSPSIRIPLRLGKLAPYLGSAIRVRGQVKFNEEKARPELFEHRLFPGLDWEAPFYRSLAEEEGVDGVLLLGGATSTLIAGQIGSLTPDIGG